MNKAPAKASDPNDLERRILDPNIAKLEAEWWAKYRIEELERERDDLRVAYHRTCQTVAEMHAAAMGAAVGPVRGVVEDIADLKAERDALQADNARLREALELIAGTDPFEAALDPQRAVRVARNALAATPEQSLDALTERIRAEAFAEVADKLEALRNRLNAALSTKEPK